MSDASFDEQDDETLTESRSLMSESEILRRSSPHESKDRLDRRSFSSSVSSEENDFLPKSKQKAALIGNRLFRETFLDLSGFENISHGSSRRAGGRLS